MALREVIKKDNPLLRKISKPVTSFNDMTDQILDDMLETMHKTDGVGIAAVQIGILKRMVIVEMNNLRLEIINPKVLETSGSQVNLEGCLSVENFNGYVKRPYKITFSAFDRMGYPYTMTVEGPVAMVVGHEFDHLDGILYIDKLTEKPEKEGN